MLVFSSAERTNSLAPSLRPFQMRWYKIQNASGLGFEIRISWEDPAAVLPRTDGVLAQPSPDGGVTDGCRQAASADVGAEFGHAPARKGHTEAMGQFAGDGFNAHDQFWGEKPGVGRGAVCPPGRPNVFQRTVFASDSRSRVACTGDRQSDRSTSPAERGGSSWREQL